MVEDIIAATVAAVLAGFIIILFTISMLYKKRFKSCFKPLKSRIEELNLQLAEIRAKHEQMNELYMRAMQKTVITEDRNQGKEITLIPNTSDMVKPTNLTVSD